MSVRDIRRAPFCWQDKAALDVLRAYYDGERLKQRSTALAIYLILTEIASNQRTPEQAETTHRAIWEMTGTSASTVKRYLTEFEALGLVQVERRKLAGDISLPNVYALLSPPGSTDGPTPSTATVPPRSTDGPTPPADGLQQEERDLTIDPKEGDQQFAIRQGRNRRLSKAQALALAAQCTREGQLDRDRFMSALPKG